MNQENHSATQVDVTLIAQCLHSLADIYEGKGDLSDLSARLESNPNAGVRRFYYIAILGRLPENEELASRPVTNRLECALEFLGSEEFLKKHIKVFRDLFPTTRASLFLHIPKTGGATIVMAQQRSNSYVVLRTPTAVLQWEPDRLLYFGRVMASLRKRDRQIAIDGHPTSQLLISLGILNADDEVFTVLRDPVSLVISYINYVLTCVAERRTHEIIDLWGKIIGMPTLSPGDEVPAYVLLKILQEVVPRNVMCGMLGGATWKEAINRIRILGIEVFFFEDLDVILKKKQLPSLPPQNTSLKFFTETNLDREVRQAIIYHTKEDMKLYHWAKAERQRVQEQ